MRTQLIKGVSYINAKIMDESEILKVVEKIIKSNISCIEIKTDNIYIKVIKNDYNETKTSNQICCTSRKSNVIQIKSMYVGIINIFDDKTNELYVKVGDKVKQGQILGTINYLKIPIDIVSSVEGIITKIYVKNNNMVEYGQVLFEIIES